MLALAISPERTSKDLNQLPRQPSWETCPYGKLPASASLPALGPGWPTPTPPSLQTKDSHDNFSTEPHGSFQKSGRAQNRNEVAKGRGIKGAWQALKIAQEGELQTGLLSSVIPCRTVKLSRDKCRECETPSPGARSSVEVTQVAELLSSHLA